MKHLHTFESFLNESLNEFGPLAGSGNIRANDLDDKKRDAAKKSEKGEMVYVVGGKHGTYKLSKYFETGNTYAAFYNGMPHVVESVNEAKLKDNSYQAVLFGKSKSGKWTIIKSTDPKTSLQTKEDLYPRGSNDKYTQYCIISGLGGNRGQSLQSDAEAHLAQLISGTINRDTANEPFSKVEFI